MVEFVNEAYNLLSQSIIHVEKDDVDIDSDDEDNDDDPELGGGGDGEEGQAGPGSPARDRTASATPAPAPAQQPKKPKVTISYDKYMLMMQRIVYMIAQHEKEEGAGMPRSAVASQYLDEIEDQINSIDQLEEETVLVDKVLTKLVKVRFAFTSSARLSCSLLTRTGTLSSRASRVVERPGGSGWRRDGSRRGGRARLDRPPRVRRPGGVNARRTLPSPSSSFRCPAPCVCIPVSLDV